MLRMLKPDPMPAADRDGQPYLLFRPLYSVIRTLYSALGTPSHHCIPPLPPYIARMRTTPALLMALLLSAFAHGAESLPLLKDGKVPENLTELWGAYDPRAEPLSAEVTKEWEQDGIVCRVVRYRIGTFKGQPATMAAFYAFPKGAKALPAILQIHGGGQSASLSAVVTNAKLGYASLSLNWGGNKMTFADGKLYDGPNTDWGALGATHPPQRNKANHFAGPTTPDAYTLDAVDSPRNDNWFLVTLSARRALTFLEQQPEVDPAKLGVTGHSMGGRLTVQLSRATWRRAPKTLTSPG